MSPTHDHRPGPDDEPTVREIAALTARLRDLSGRGRDIDPHERARFLADKDALLARIAATEADPPSQADHARADDLSKRVRARATQGGYVLVGVSARTWSRDPDTGRPVAPVPDAEHHAVRELLAGEVLDTSEPRWVTGDDGGEDLHSTVIPHAVRHNDDASGDGDTLSGPSPWTAAVGTGAVPHSHAVLGNRIDPADTDRADPPQDRPWTAQVATIDTAEFPISSDDARVSETDQRQTDRAVPELAMPEWTREQARRTEAEVAAGTAPPVRADDTAVLTARVEALREQIAARDQGSAMGQDGRPVGRPPCCVVLDTEQHDARREQLTRWHTDDTPTRDDTDTDTDDGADDGAAGRSWDWWDGPGLP